MLDGGVNRNGINEKIIIDPLDIDLIHLIPLPSPVFINLSSIWGVYMRWSETLK